MTVETQGPVAAAVDSGVGRNDGDDVDSRLRGNDGEVAGNDGEVAGNGGELLR